jgi:hypothetical protein
MLIARIRGMIARTLGFILMVLTFGKVEINWSGASTSTESDDAPTPVTDTWDPPEEDGKAHEL